MVDIFLLFTGEQESREGIYSGGPARPGHSLALLHEEREDDRWSQEHTGTCSTIYLYII